MAVGGGLERFELFRLWGRAAWNDGHVEDVVEIGDWFANGQRTK